MVAARSLRARPGPSVSIRPGACIERGVAVAVRAGRQIADVAFGFGTYDGARPGAPRRRATRTSLSPKANARMLDPDCGHVAAMAEVADGPSRRGRRSSRPRGRQTP